MEILSVEEVRKAMHMIKKVIHRTPLDYSSTCSHLTGNEVYFKLENLQKAGSFKIRGASYKIFSLKEEEKRRGVVAASAGNHAQGVALAAKIAKIDSTVVMPKTAPLSKITATKNYGAKVILEGEDYDEAYKHALAINKESGAIFIHGFDDQYIITGQGTIALELQEDLPDLDAILVPVGGGGLISGIALAYKELKPGIQIIGIQAAGAPSMYLSQQEGKICKLPSVRTIADGIAIRRPGELTFQLVQKYVDDLVIVDDEEIASAILFLMERSKTVVEGAGAVGLAALLHEKVNIKQARIAVILSGGNIDMNILSIIIERGLVKAGRYVHLRTVLSDRPGNLQGLLTVVAAAQANVISISHDRIQPRVPLQQAEVELILEARDREHIEHILGCLSKEGYTTEIVRF